MLSGYMLHSITKKYELLPPFQIIGCFGFSRRSILSSYAPREPKQPIIWDRGSNCFLCIVVIVLGYSFFSVMASL